MRHKYGISISLQIDWHSHHHLHHLKECTFVFCESPSFPTADGYGGLGSSGWGTHNTGWSAPCLFTFVSLTSDVWLAHMIFKLSVESTWHRSGCTEHQTMRLFLTVPPARYLIAFFYSWCFWQWEVPGIFLYPLLEGVIITAEHSEVSGHSHLRVFENSTNMAGVW